MRAFLAAATGLSVAVIGCGSGCGKGSAATESTSDSSSEVLAVDADAEVLRDSAFVDSAYEADSGSAVDAPNEAGPDAPYFGDWTALSGNAASCGAVLSLQPTVAAPPLKWTTCPSGRPACKVLEVDWSAPALGATFDVLNRGAFRNAGVRSLLYRRWLAKTPDDHKRRSLLILQAVDGPASIALREDESATIQCYFAAAVGPYGFGAWGGMNPALANFIVSAPWETLRPTEADVSLSDLGPPTPSAVQRVAVSVRDIFLEATSPDGIASFHLPSGAAFPRSALAEYAVGVPDGALAVNFASSGVTLISPDSTWKDLIAPAPSATVTWVSVDRANSNSIVWVESTTDSTGMYASPTIWMSAYSNATAGIARHKVAILSDVSGSGGAGMVVDSGVALVILDAALPTARAAVIRLADGLGWTIPVEPGFIAASALWVGDDEVGIGVKPTDRPGPPTTIQRLDRGALGPPAAAGSL